MRRFAPSTLLCRVGLALLGLRVTFAEASSGSESWGESGAPGVAFGLRPDYLYVARPEH